MSIYAKFETAVDREVDGIVFEFPEASLRVTLARAGGANRAFAKALTSTSARVRRALETNTMRDEDARKVMVTAYADAIIRKWETMTSPGVYEVGIESPEGGLLPFTRENVIATLTALPALFDTFQACASDWQHYLSSNVQAEAKN